MLRTTQAVIDAAERIPDLTPIAEDAGKTLREVFYAAENVRRLCHAAGNGTELLISGLNTRSDELQFILAKLNHQMTQVEPILTDARETVSAWKTAGHAVTVAAVVVAMAAAVGLLVVSTWKPEEFR